MNRELVCTYKTSVKKSPLSSIFGVHQWVRSILGPSFHVLIYLKERGLKGLIRDLADAIVVVVVAPFATFPEGKMNTGNGGRQQGVVHFEKSRFEDTRVVLVLGYWFVWKGTRSQHGR